MSVFIWHLCVKKNKPDLGLLPVFGRAAESHLSSGKQKKLFKFNVYSTVKYKYEATYTQKSIQKKIFRHRKLAV